MFYSIMHIREEETVLFGNLFKQSLKLLLLVKLWADQWVFMREIAIAL